MLAFVVLLLSTVTFDGFTATPLWRDVQVSLYDVIHNSTNIKTLGSSSFRWWSWPFTWPSPCLWLL